ncbi:MAG: hypothetical protein KBT03_04620 [Bacteroidales bacterium]|nr:hypothetical protein [Candidatus Scybalousia scybalohippi]
MKEIKICAFCGKPFAIEHHLIFGTSQRALSDQDGLIINLCDGCHNMNSDAKMRIHGNIAAEKLSKMLGQAIYEQTHTREEFMARYGRSYL